MEGRDDGRHFLLVRRCLDDKAEKAYYFVFAPVGTTLAEMVQAIGQRWKIEECFETGKEMGMEDYEVRGFTTWYRFITLVMVVMACLASICAAALTPGTTPPLPEGTCPLLPLTIRRACAIYWHPCSGPCLAARPCSSLGPGGGAATRAGPATFIRDVVALPGNSCLARSSFLFGCFRFQGISLEFPSIS
jgi:hypothetical protein